jgi:alpha 1,2-mannosyltransferase
MNRIIYLLKNDPKEIGMLFKSLELLNANFLPNNNYPIYILHDEPISDETFQQLKEYSGVDFTTVLISFETDEYKSKTVGVPDQIMVPGIDRGFGIGYRHMCRFYSYGMYLIPELQDTNYYLRLDCDSYFTKTVDFDIFKHMENGGFIYGYNQITTDNPLVSQGLWETSKEYSKTVDVIKVPIDEIRQYNVYYTNFEIAKFGWFSESVYKGFFNHVDEVNGIYIYRWGDHCIKYLGVEMFLEDSKKCHLNLPYSHGNIYNINEFQQFINR